MIKEFNGKSPRIHSTAFVSKAAYVIGDVQIGENSGVWPGAVIRADFAKITIGTNTMVEDNCVLHTGFPMEIGDNVIIGHGVVVHGKKIGNNNLIGNHATILDHSEIGNFCVIGAGSLIPPGMKIPDNSRVIGIPGRIAKQDYSEFIQGFKDGLAQYKTLLKEYKRQGL